MVFTVEDNGVGISDDDLVRLGEPYFQARSSYDRRHGGTGLGLSIVKGLVRLHGGDIGIRSRVGQGTRVTVRLPLDCERARASLQAAPQPAFVAPVVLTPSADEPSDAAVREVPAALLDRRVKKSA